MKRYKIGDEELDTVEQKTMEDVQQCGWHVMLVMPTADTQEFPVLQCVWSDPAGRFPWERDFESSLAGLQPNLAADPGSSPELEELDG